MTIRRFEEFVRSAPAIVRLTIILVPTLVAVLGPSVAAYAFQYGF